MGRGWAGLESAVLHQGHNASHELTAGRGRAGNRLPRAGKCALGLNVEVLKCRCGTRGLAQPRFSRCRAPGGRVNPPQAATIRDAGTPLCRAAGWGARCGSRVAMRRVKPQHQRVCGSCRFLLFPILRGGEPQRGSGWRSQRPPSRMGWGAPSPGVHPAAWGSRVPAALPAQRG